jgi:hypothetical protein
MSTIDIEAPGVDEAALKAAIQALVPISTTTISSPVNYVDITLPSGYSAFRLVVTNVYYLDPPIALVGAFSQDGGATWLEDFATDGDAYKVHFIRRNGTALTSDDWDAGAIEFSLLSGVVSAGWNINAMIYPGSATRLAMVTAEIVTDGASDYDGVALAKSLCRDNTARVNAIRLIPDNGSTGPGAPDVAYFIGSGATVSLYGVL